MFSSPVLSFNEKFNDHVKHFDDLFWPHSKNHESAVFSVWINENAVFKISSNIIISLYFNNVLNIQYRLNYKHDLKSNSSRNFIIP